MLASTGNKCATILGASHTFCRLGKHCAVLGAAIPGCCYSSLPGLSETLGFLPLGCVIPAIASITSKFTHSNKQAKSRLIVTELITPNPLKRKGALEQPSSPKGLT
jgi:hypothetical protein